MNKDTFLAKIGPLMKHVSLKELQARTELSANTIWKYVTIRKPIKGYIMEIILKAAKDIAKEKIEQMSELVNVA